MDIKESNEFTKRLYDLHEIKYTLYEGNDRFFGTPIPEGYQAIYNDENDLIPPSLILNKIKVE